MKKQKGFTLIEMGIVMVVGVLLVTGIALSGKDGMDAAKINRAVDAVGLLRTAASRYGSPTDFSGMTLSTITVRHSIGNGIGTNPWGGNYALTVNNAGADYTVTLTEVPLEASGPLMKAFDQGASTASSYDGTVLTVGYDE